MRDTATCNPAIGNMKEFKQIKDKLYYDDGTYIRDVVIESCTDSDYEKLFNYLDTIGISLKRLDADESEVSFYFMLGLCKVIVRPQSLDMDIDAREFQTIEDHNRLIQFLVGLSKSLNKNISLNPELNTEYSILRINADRIEWS